VSPYDNISRQIDQAEAMMRDAESRLGKFQSLRAELTDLVGHAESADGYVVVEWSGGGLSDLQLNPRAMRLPSDELAEAIKTAIRDARTDLGEKTQAALNAAGLEREPLPSLDDVRAQLGQMREQSIDSARKTVTGLDQAMQYRRNSGR
jgi:DNA-binding protein YbaB